MARPVSPVSALEAVRHLIAPEGQAILNAQIDQKVKESSHELADGFAPTDAGNADRFVSFADGRVLYVEGWKSWVVYRKGVWEVDKGSGLVMKGARQIAARLRSLANEDGISVEECKALRRHADRCEMTSSIKAMLEQAKADLARPASIFDRQLEKLNVLNGTIDLRSGQLLPSRPEDYFTTQAPVEYDPEAKPDFWLQCLDQWQPNKAVRDYLQMVMGTCLTGHPVRHFFLNTGVGSNGKTSFFDTISRVLGTYATELDKSVVIRSRNDDNKTRGKMDLFGVRMAVTKESESGEWLAEAEVKALTGGDAIKGRKLYQDFWQFEPTHTLFMHTNNTPPIRNNDQAIWKRIRLIPWLAKFEGKGEILKHELDARFATEFSGILAWLVEGAQKWLVAGALDEPKVIQDATEQYRQDEDVLGRFISQCFELGPDYSCFLEEIDKAAKLWFRNEGMEPWHRKNLSRKLKDERGFTGKPSTGNKYRFYGLRISQGFQNEVKREDEDETINFNLN